ncbi:MAG: hypothetical protein WCT20_04015 [Candidatus Babeliales bacterium]
MTGPVVTALTGGIGIGAFAGMSATYYFCRDDGQSFIDFIKKHPLKFATGTLAGALIVGGGSAGTVYWIEQKREKAEAEEAKKLAAKAEEVQKLKLKNEELRKQQERQQLVLQANAEIETLKRIFKMEKIVPIDSEITELTKNCTQLEDERWKMKSEMDHLDKNSQQYKTYDEASTLALRIANIDILTYATNNDGVTETKRALEKELQALIDSDTTLKTYFQYDDDIKRLDKQIRVLKSEKFHEECSNSKILSLFGQTYKGQGLNFDHTQFLCS